MLESLFNKVAGFQAYNFVKKRLQHRHLPVNIANFLRTRILKNTCVRLLLFKVHHERLFDLFVYSNVYSIRYRFYIVSFLILLQDHTLRKIPKFQLISWCGNFVETHNFRRLSRNSAETVRFFEISTSKY